MVVPYRIFGSNHFEILTSIHLTFQTGALDFICSIMARYGYTLTRRCTNKTLEQSSRDADIRLRRQEIDVILWNLRVLLN
jgi:hypothetical protein